MKAHCYRISTEYLPENFHAIKVFLTNNLESFKLDWGEGCWKRTEEKAVTIEYVVSGNKFDMDARASYIAEQIRSLNHQEAVIVYSWPVDMWLETSHTA